MVAGALVWGLGWQIADPIASVVIALLVLYASFTLLRETVDVLLEAARPPASTWGELEGALMAVDGVGDVHDLHVWTITSGMTSLSCHVHSEGAVDHHVVLSSLQKLLRERYAIHHVTIQVEPEGFEEQVEVC